MKPISNRRRWVARGLAVVADGVQFSLAAVFAEGIASPLADGLDIIMCGLMTWLLGWHFAFLPTFAVKLLPMADLAPCWTIAVLLTTRRQTAPPAAPKTEVGSQN